MMNNRHRKASLSNKIVQVVISLFATLEIRRRKKIKGKKKMRNIKLQLNKLADNWEYLFISLPAWILLIISIFSTKHLEEFFMIYLRNPELLLESLILSLVAIVARMSYKFWYDWGERREYNRPDYRSIRSESTQTLPGCRGCKNLHGRIYNGNLLVCGIHPFGKENCPDYK